MPKKDFLDQFSTNNVPDSFKKEELKPVKKNINVTKILIVVLVFLILILSAFAIYLYLNRATIEVPNFVGGKASDVTNWVKQQEIEPNGIVYKEEYNDDFEEKIIIDQSIPEGSVVKKDVKIDFTISLGPDPNALIAVPDISTMNLSSIKDWINNNKLRGVKLNYEFSDLDSLDSVISFVFGNNINETNFTRTSSLTITISKGKQSDQAITLPNFIGKNVSEVETWGSKNKIKIIKKEEYSSTVQKDIVISQSVNVGKKISSKESLTVNVSRGEAIYAPDFSSYSEQNINAWATKNLVNVEYVYEYNADIAEGKVIKQDHVGQPVNDGMTVTMSKGDISKNDFPGGSVDDLKAWIDEVNKYGAGLSLDKNINRQNDDNVPVGEIISIDSFHIGSKIKITVSKGRNIWLIDYVDADAGIDLKWADVVNEQNPELNYTEEDIRKLCMHNDGLSYKVVYEVNDAYYTNRVIRIKRSDDNALASKTYISQDVQVIITICEKGINQ